MKNDEKVVELCHALLLDPRRGSLRLAPAPVEVRDVGDHLERAADDFPRGRPDSHQLEELELRRGIFILVMQGF